MDGINEIRQQWQGLLDEGGLPSAALGFDRVRQALLLGQRENLAPTMMAIHWDSASGDVPPAVVQRLVAERTAAVLRTYDTVFLIGEYVAVLLPDAKDDSARAAASRLMWRLMQPYEWNGTEFTVRPSGGVSVAGLGDDCPGVVDLWQNATAALERARARGGGFAASRTVASEALVHALG
jgi:hypothetical protein